VGPIRDALVLDQGEGPLLLGITGWRSRAQSVFWTQFAECQAQDEHGHPMVVVDLFGAAARAKSIIDAAVELLDQVVDDDVVETIRGDRPIVLVGHSLGGWPIAEYLTRQGGWPIAEYLSQSAGRRAVLVAPAVPPLPRADIRKLALGSGRLLLPGSQAFMSGLADEWSELHGPYSPGDVPWLMRAAWQLNWQALWRFRPERIPGTVLSVLFDEDAFAVPEKERRLLYGAGNRVVARLPGRHTPVDDEVALLSAIVGEFATETEG
jgi:pimeloyl-ACP methyl ester carboxylesterase